MPSASTKRGRPVKPSATIGRVPAFRRRQIRTLERMAATPSTGELAWLARQLQADR